MTDMLPLIMQCINFKLNVIFKYLPVLPVLAITVFSIEGWLFKQSDWRLFNSPPSLDKTIFFKRIHLCTCMYMLVFTG